jgi:arsenate reductase (thioredoxin)
MRRKEEIFIPQPFSLLFFGDANDQCPVTPSHVCRLHWGLEDPAKATGSEEEITAKFHEVRDAIRERVTKFLGEINE